MKNMGSVLMKGQLTRKYLCGAILTNGRKLSKYSKLGETREINEGIIEVYSDDEIVHSDPYMKSLYPNANKISSYYHDICGYDVLLVDGKFQGELNNAYDLLAYAYHCGVSYTDREDLEMQYLENLECGEERWFFLP